MTDGDCILRDVLESPADDAPRLVYADWLDENGEGERAEFIRVQCELVRLTDGPYWQHRLPPDVPASRVNTLRRRERKLWHQIPTCKVFAPWAAGISTDPDAPRFWLGDQSGPLLTVRRGFVESVTLTTTAFVGGPCDRCEGRRTHTSTGLRTTRTCPTCGGSGTRPGVAEALFRAHPVTEVRLTDREPYRLGSYETSWWDAARPGQSVPPNHQASDLPTEVFVRLPHGRDENDLDRYRVKVYPDWDTADAALRVACIALGRQRAGLAPLPNPPAPRPSLEPTG